MLDFDTVQAALERLGASVGAAEAHGTLCALLLVQATPGDWLAHTLESVPDSANLLAVEQLSVLERLFEQTREGLNGEDLAFELLLPDESDEFGQRLLALADWCQGFLYGFGVAGPGEDALDDEARECLSDLLEISKLSHDETASEAAETQYAEIVEHVRMATLLLNESLNPPGAASTIH